MKPIYIGGKIENSWIRTGDGDRKATTEELAALMRNAQPNQDSLPLDNYSFEDLDDDSVLSYKERVNKRFPKKKYLEMSNEAFLVEIGACVKDRNTNEIKIKKRSIVVLRKM